MLRFRGLVGDITYIHTREGFVYPAGRDEAALVEKNCWLRHGRETCEPTCLHNVLQNWRFGTASPSRV